MKTEQQPKSRLDGKPSTPDDTLIRPVAGDAVVVGTGLITLDVVINSDVRRPPRLYAGGTCGNVLAILSHLGWRSYPVARLNGDTASKRVLRDLKEWGVDVRYAKQQPTASTPMIVHEIRHGRDGTPSHKFTWTCPQCGAWLPTYKAVTADAASRVAPRLKDVKVFFMDRVARGALILAEACADNGALVVFEPAGVGDPKMFREALALTHVLKYSHERVKSFGDLVKRAGAPLLEVETRGRGGLRYRSRSADRPLGKWQEVLAYTVPRLKDAAGAGDWCTAGILHILGQRGIPGLAGASALEVHKAINLGQAMAAWTCGFEGARGGMYESDKASFRAAVTEMISNSPAESTTATAARAKAVGSRKKNICPACEQRKHVPLR